MNRTQHPDIPPYQSGQSSACGKPACTEFIEVLNWVISPSKNQELQTKNWFYKTNPNVGDLSLPKGEASVLHIIEKTKQSQFPSFSIENQRSPSKTNPILFTKSVSSAKFYALGTVVPSFYQTNPKRDIAAMKNQTNPNPSVGEASLLRYHYPGPKRHPHVCHFYKTKPNGNCGTACGLAAALGCDQNEQTNPF